MEKENYPDFLTHYHEASRGPFVSLSDLSLENTETILSQIRREGVIFAGKRDHNYLEFRERLEEQIRILFIEKGGQPKRAKPYYFILGTCDWVKSWYQEGREIRISLSTIPAKGISFTYGDSFLAMRYQDGKPYRGQVYTLEEISKVVELWGIYISSLPNLANLILF